MWPPLGCYPSTKWTPINDPGARFACRDHHWYAGPGADNHSQKPTTALEQNTALTAHQCL